jgi:hypothetical protein
MANCRFTPEKFSSITNIISRCIQEAISHHNHCYFTILATVDGYTSGLVVSPSWAGQQETARLTPAASFFPSSFPGKTWRLLIRTIAFCEEFRDLLHE